MIIAVVNSKGGVGKTTAAVNLGAALASPRRRILLVDLDSQAAASLWCGIDRGRLKPSSASCLLEDYSARQAIRPTRLDHLDLITGSVELANADLVLGPVPGRELVLKELLHGLRTRYEYFVLDCPPSLSLVSINALVAADALVVPVTPQYLAAEGLGTLLASIEKVRVRLHAKTRLLGILLNMIDAKRAARSELAERLRAQHRERIFHTEIPLSQALEEAPRAGQDVLAFAPKSAAADAFRRLAGEVLERSRVVRR